MKGFGQKGTVEQNGNMNRRDTNIQRDEGGMENKKNSGGKGEEKKEDKNRREVNMDRRQVDLLARRDKGCERREKKEEKRS